MFITLYNFFVYFLYFKIPAKVVKKWLHTFVLKNIFQEKIVD